MQPGGWRFAARLAGSELLERAALLLLDDDGLQIGDALLQLVDEHVLLAETIGDAGIPQLVAGPLAEKAEQCADEDDQYDTGPHGHE